MNNSTNLKIAVVDDMPTIRTMVKNMVHDLGYSDITSFESATTALEDVLSNQKSGTPYQLIISDWNMLEMDGLEFLKRIRDNPETSNIAFLMVTTVSEKSKIIEALSFGVSHYIMKPITANDLDEKISVVLKKHGYTS